MGGLAATAAAQDLLRTGRDGIAGAQPRIRRRDSSHPGQRRCDAEREDEQRRCAPGSEGHRSMIDDSGATPDESARSLRGSSIRAAAARAAQVGVTR
jgi:hypothetical protein